MKWLVITCFLSLFLNCSQNPKAKIPFIEGYWEIEEVILEDGSKKIYGFNDTIDYIQLFDSLAGFRKKLKPNLTGSFETSNDVETFQIKIENDSLNLYYKTQFANWKETVLVASENEFLIINKAKVRYLYKRYHPLDLSNDQTQ